MHTLRMQAGWTGKKAVLAFLCVVLVLVSLATQALAKQTLVWYSFNPNWAKDAAGVWVEEFKQRRNVDIDLVITTWAELREKVTIAVAGGTPPDVLTIDVGWEELGAAGILEDLNPYIARDPEFPRNDLFERNLESRQGPRGEQWVLPANVDTTLLFYNKSLFDARGLAVPDRNTDWAAWLEMGTRLTYDTSGDGIVDHFGLTVWNTPWVWQLMALANGAQLFTPEREPNFGSPAAREAYEFHRQWLERGVIPGGNIAHSGFPGEREAFLGGRIAMKVVAPWWANNIRNSNAEFDWNVALMPQAKTGRRPIEIKGSGMAVVSQSPRKDLAYEFAKQVVMFDTASIIAKTTGSLVTNIPASRRWSMLPEQFPHVNRSVVLEAPLFGEPWPRNVFWDSISAEYRRQMDPYFRGSIGLEDAITNAEIAVRAVLQNLEAYKR